MFISFFSLPFSLYTPLAVYCVKYPSLRQYSIVKNDKMPSMLLVLFPQSQGTCKHAFVPNLFNIHAALGNFIAFCMSALCYHFSYPLEVNCSSL